MTRKRIRAIIISVAVFYLIVSVLAFFMLKESESVLADKTMAELLFGNEETTEAAKTGSGGNDPLPEIILDRPTEKGQEEKTETFMESNTEFISGRSTETIPEPELITESITSEATEEVTTEATETAMTTEKTTDGTTEKVTDRTTEKTTDGTTEKATEKTTEASTGTTAGTMVINDGKYYSFVSSNALWELRMRAEPNEKSKTVTTLQPKTPGIVLEKGDPWTKVFARGKTGYCYNQYLAMTEVTKEEYEELKKKYGYKDEGVQSGP